MASWRPWHNSSAGGSRSQIPGKPQRHRGTEIAQRFFLNASQSRRHKEITKPPAHPREIKIGRTDVPRARRPVRRSGVTDARIRNEWASHRRQVIIRFPVVLPPISGTAFQAQQPLLCVVCVLGGFIGWVVGSAFICVICGFSGRIPMLICVICGRSGWVDGAVPLWFFCQ